MCNTKTRRKAIYRYESYPRYMVGAKYCLAIDISALRRSRVMAHEPSCSHEYSTKKVRVTQNMGKDI